MLGMVVTAAGSGVRFGGEKILAPIRGEPLVFTTLRRLSCVDATAEIVLVLAPRRLDEIRREHGDALAELGVVRFAPGGEIRQDSVRSGVEALSADVDVVLVHDAVRPVFSVGAAIRAVEVARRTGAAIVGIPARDTLKRVDDEPSIVETVPREGIWHAETPQVIRRDLLEAAYRVAAADGFVGTDEASIIERFGRRVAMVRGGPFNVKVTEREDLRVVEAILAGEVCE